MIEDHEVDLLFARESHLQSEHLPPLLYPHLSDRSLWAAAEPNPWGVAVFLDKAKDLQSTVPTTCNPHSRLRRSNEQHSYALLAHPAAYPQSIVRSKRVVVYATRGKDRLWIGWPRKGGAIIIASMAVASFVL